MGGLEAVAAPLEEDSDGVDDDAPRGPGTRLPASSASSGAPASSASSGLAPPAKATALAVAPSPPSPDGFILGGRAAGEAKAKASQGLNLKSLRLVKGSSTTRSARRR